MERGNRERERQKDKAIEEVMMARTFKRCICLVLVSGDVSPAQSESLKASNRNSLFLTSTTLQDVTNNSSANLH